MIRAGAVQMPFRYAAGEWGSRFLAALRDEQRILGGQCTACARVACPPPPACTACRGVELRPVTVGPAGTLISWTTVPGRGVFCLVRLDGADTSMLHLLLGDGPTRTQGGRVRARFRDVRTGSINDIEGFEPAKEDA